MNSLSRKASAAAIGASLVGGGVFVGILASSLTTDALVWRPVSQIPMTEGPIETPVDQAGAGQAWARTAFDGGLRQCPEMNDTFLAACQEEMKKLAARPAFVPGSYGGPLLITRVEPVRSDDAWDAQDQLETPRHAAVQLDPLPEPDPEPAFEPTPANYPAAPESDDPPA